MSDANLTKLLFKKETTFGVVPAGNPKFQELRFLSSGLSHSKLTVMSDEIRSDRARSDLIQVGKDAAGPVETEFICGAYDDFILAALLAQSWTTGSVTMAGTTTSAGGVTWFTRASGTFSAALKGAKYVWINSIYAANDGIKRVVSCTDTVLTWAGDGSNQTETISVTYKYARNGVYLDSFSLEQQYLSLATPHYIALLGMVVNQWSLNMEAQARVLQTFDFLGTKAVSDDATVGDGSPTDPSTRYICNTTGNIGGLIWDNAAFTSNVMSFTMALNNNLRNRPAISSETTLKHGKGRCEPNGTLNCYFESAALWESFLAHTAASLLLPIIDPDGNLCSIHMPHLEFPSGFPTITGINSDVMLPLEYNATYDDTLRYVIQVDRLDVAAGS